MPLGADRLHNRVVSTGGVEGATEIVGLLRRPIVGMTEEGLGNADMRGIANRQLRRNDLSKEVRVEVAAKLAFRDRADRLPTSFAVSGLPPSLIQNASPATGVGERRTSCGR